MLGSSSVFRGDLELLGSGSPASASYVVARMPDAPASDLKINFEIKCRVPVEPRCYLLVWLDLFSWLEFSYLNGNYFQSE